MVDAGMTLARFVEDFVSALKAADSSGVAHKQFQPGIGPFGEADAVKAALAVLRSKGVPNPYEKAVTKRQPDLLIPGEWQVEFKVIRPFGDNGKEAENWSQNLLHPYAGNTSSLGDCLKLATSPGPERKAVVVFGYEHEPAKIPLDPCVRGFELLASSLLGIELSQRIEQRRSGLIHPVHQVLRVFAWEVIRLLG
ncbi:MAG: hypothetical protein BWY06_01129 [Candidatus Latescibacteria bacterium ADurb.Bin168]|nr:MAG: hypothetical protein BWY06_01129 [Candidatus Latescibacteria bacterium ADurb.Bin168]